MATNLEDITHIVIENTDTALETRTFYVSLASLCASVLVPIAVTLINNIYQRKRQERAIATKENRDNKSHERAKIEKARQFLSDYDLAIKKVFEEYTENDNIEGFTGDSKEPFEKLESQFFLHFPQKFKEDIDKLHKNILLIFKPKHYYKPSVYIEKATLLYDELKPKLDAYLDEEEQKLDNAPLLSPESDIPKEKSQRFWRNKKKFDKVKK